MPFKNKCRVAAFLGIKRVIVFSMILSNPRIAVLSREATKVVR